MRTKVAKRSPSLFPEIVQRLESGEIILLPTDTVYALVANANNPQAVTDLLKLKNFGHLQPLAIFSNKQKASEVVFVTQAAELMMSHFPYPITMIMRATNKLSDKITQGFKNVCVVCPDPFIYDLVEVVPFPMVCVSAKVADVKITNFEMAHQYFKEKVPLIVDGGKSKYGCSGTLIDFTLEIPTIMSFGTVSVDDLRPLIPEIILPSHLMK